MANSIYRQLGGPGNGWERLKTSKNSFQTVFFKSVHGVMLSPIGNECLKHGKHDLQLAFHEKNHGSRAMHIFYLASFAIFICTFLFLFMWLMGMHVLCSVLSFLHVCVDCYKFYACLMHIDVPGLSFRFLMFECSSTSWSDNS